MSIEQSINKQQAILLAISLFWRKNGYAPSIRELQALCDISSTSVVTYHLERLRERGLIDYADGSARTLHLVNREGGAV